MLAAVLVVLAVTVLEDELAVELVVLAVAALVVGLAVLAAGSLARSPLAASPSVAERLPAAAGSHSVSVTVTLEPLGEQLRSPAWSLEVFE